MKPDPYEPRDETEHERQGAAAGTAASGWLSRHVLYPDVYTWFVFLAAMDVMVTRIVLFFQGSEVNWLARWVIHNGGITGVVIYKFALVVIVVLICEVVGRYRQHTGRRLAVWCCAVTAFPVVAGLLQLLIVAIRS